MISDKKGAMGLDSLSPAAISFVFIAIVLSIGATILSTVQTDGVTNTAGCNSTDVTACGYDYNATANGLESVDTLSGWLPTIGLVIAAAVVIGVLVLFRW